MSTFMPIVPAQRGANGNWSEIANVMPLITQLISETGWHSFVMEKFLNLCERAGKSYPVDDFDAQVNAALGKIKAVGLAQHCPPVLHRFSSVLPRRTIRSGLAERGGLLRILDALIDLGDRRSAALVQNEIFRRIQGAAA